MEAGFTWAEHSQFESKADIFRKSDKVALSMSALSIGLLLAVTLISQLFIK